MRVTSYAIASAPWGEPASRPRVAVEPVDNRAFVRAHRRVGRGESDASPVGETTYLGQVSSRRVSKRECVAGSSSAVSCGNHIARSHLPWREPLGSACRQHLPFRRLSDDAKPFGASPCHSEGARLYLGFFTPHALCGDGQTNAPTAALFPKTTIRDGSLGVPSLACGHAHGFWKGSFARQGVACSA
jgi:hypothetical protein